MQYQTAEQAQQEIINEFNFFPDWLERYQYIIELGKKLPQFPLDKKIEKYKVQGCQSQVWLYKESDNGKLLFYATSDAVIVCGLLAIILRIYNNRTKEEILLTPPRFIRELGLDKHLSMNRTNGLYAVLKQIEDYAANE